MSKEYVTGYPANDYRDYLEHSAKGQTWSRHKYLYITPNGTYVYPKKKRKPVDDYWLWDSKDIDRDTYVNVGRQGNGRPKRYSIRDYYIPDQSHPEIVAVSYKRGYLKAHKPGERNRKRINNPRQKGTIKRLKKYYFENGKYSFANSKKRSKQNRLISRVLKNRIR